MADNLIFPIGFDLDKAVEQAKGDWPSIQKKMETMLSSKPMRIPISIEPTKEVVDAEGNLIAATGSIKAMRMEMNSLIKRWNELSQAQRLTTDSNGKFIGEAGQIVSRFAELTTASRTYARTLSELQSAADKAVEQQKRAEEKSYAEWSKINEQVDYDRNKRAQQERIRLAKEESLVKATADREYLAWWNSALKAQDAEEKRYQNWLSLKEKEVQKAEAAEAKKRASYEASLSAQRKAAHEESLAAFKIAQALKSQETSLDNINAKLQIYQQRINGQEISSSEWNKSSIEIRRLSEELAKANQQMSDFQQKSFKGLSDTLTTDKVQQLTRYREELAKLDAEFNKLNQSGAAYNANGTLTSDANNVLKKRQEIVKNINQMLITASDAQVQREKEINRIIEQRKAKAEAIAAKRKEEQAAIQANIARLKEERRILNQQESSIANITAKLQIYQRRLQTEKLGSQEFLKTANEVERLTLKLERAKQQVDAVTGRIVSGAKRQEDAYKSVNKELTNHTSYLQRLGQIMAAYWSVRQVFNFLSGVREVTAEFELQRISLGAIIQDQTRANALFSEIKSFALKSPVKILDLTKYTKQLAAYRIETEDLFETTKKLTDVSVGLGVAMDRVILAYGQTRATGYLRASEIRQFTEMGVPIVEELAAKLSKMNGELVTAAQVMDMVSKRGISFELVKEVFDDMTSAGGMFYNMQEKQGNSLFGMWAKLGDAASVMYDQIGNTEWVNENMKTAIQLLTEFMRNWKAIGATMTTEAIGAGAFLLGKKAISKGTEIEESKVAAASLRRANAQARLNEQLAIGTQADIAAAKAALQKAQADESAAIAASKNVGMVSKLKTGFAALGKSLMTGLGIGLVIALVSSLVFKLMDAIVNANRLKKELDGITAEGSTTVSRLVTNFESLANKAVKAADGSKEQRDALSELHRTYKNIIPTQELTIEKLREMRGEYTNLTIAIREYVREQQLQKGLDAIADKYTKEIIDAENQLKKNLKDTRFKAKGGSYFALDESQIDRVIQLFKQLVTEGKSAQEALKTAFEFEGINDLVDSYDKIANDLGLIKKYQTKTLSGTLSKGFSVSTLWVDEGVQGLTKSLLEQTKAIEDFKKQMDDNIAPLGRFKENLDEARKSVEEYTYATKEGTIGYDIETAKMQIDAYLNAMQKSLSQAGLKIDLSKYITIDAEGIKNFDFEAFDKVLSGINSQYKVPLINLSKEVKKIYDGFIPTDAVAKQIRARFFEIAGSMGESGDMMRRYLWKGEGDLKEHIKNLNESITDYEAEIYRMNVAISKGGLLGMIAQTMYGGKIEEYTKLVDALKQLMDMEQSYVKVETNKSSTGTKSDPRLGILQEMVSTLKQINKEYEDLAKKEGDTKALEDTKKVYANTLKSMQELAQKYNLNMPTFSVPTDTASLTKYLNSIKNVMEKLPKSDKNVLSLQVDIEKLNIDEQQKNIEEELKKLSAQVSRTKTAKEFYDNILGITKDADLAINVTTSIYGDAGTDIKKRMADYVTKLFDSIDIQVPVDIITKQGDIDYTALEKFAIENKKILGDSYKELISIAQSGQKDIAKVFEGYMKDLEVAKTFADKRIELARDTAKKIADIEKSTLSKSEKESLISGYNERESREAAKLEYEAFKDTPLYTQMFEDLENASTSTLEMMKKELQSLQGVWGTALDPTQLKEIQSRMNEIDGQLRSRNPFKTLVASVKAYKETLKGYTVEGAEDIVGQAAEKYQAAKIKGGKEAQAAEKTLKIEQRRLKIVKTLTDVKGKQLKGQEALNKAMQAASDNEADAYVKLNEALAEEKKAIESGSKDEISKARTKVEAAREEYNLAVETSKLVQQQSKSYKTLTDNLVSAGKTISEIGGGIADIGQSIAGLMEAFGAAEEDTQYINDMSNALNDILGGAGKILQSFQKGDIVGTITNAITAPINMVKGFVNLFSAGRVRKANKEIKRQHELLEQMQYTYSRLESVADKLFGTDYLNNYNQQIKNLQAQQTAYLKQAEAERSKGKKADKEKIKDYENQARETADKIKEIQDDLVSRFTGSSRTDVARQMAQSWIDARASMSNTFNAIKGDYQNLIKNMIVEGSAARVIENALTPVWNSMQQMLDNNNVQGAIDSLINGMDSALSSANNSMEILWKALEARGYDMKQLVSDTDSEYTGIAKTISGATSEEINNVAAIGNTLMYYVSPIPRMDENLAAIRRLMESGSGQYIAPKVTGWTDWQQQAMDNYNAIAKNTADTIVECRRSAEACEKIASQFSRIIRINGRTAGINTFINN